MRHAHARRSLHDCDAHGLGGADDRVADGLQRYELAPRIRFLNLHDAQTLAQRDCLNASARLCDFEDVFQRDGPPRRMPRLLASRQDACARRAASADAEMRKALTLGTAPAAFLIKYVAGGFFTTCAHGSGAERGQTGQACQALRAMTQAHKVEALVLVRGHSSAHSARRNTGRTFMPCVRALNSLQNAMMFKPAWCEG